MMLNQPLQLISEYRDYVWGGDRLRPGHHPTAEAWVVYENDRVASGPLAGRTLAEVASEYGPALLGQLVFKQTGSRFPLLIKLLDCAQWLSLQVHPNDEQARRLEGEGFYGKTEAWHVLESAEEAQLIAGIRPGTSAETLAEAIRNGTVLDCAQYLPVKAGDTIFMAPGTLHALGPGLLIYEVQQTSDLTYRVWDWNRPQTGRRVLHIDKSLMVVNHQARVQPIPLPQVEDGQRATLVQCPYFKLELLALVERSMNLDTQGEAFHALTVIEGSAKLEACDETWTLNQFQSAVIPADCGGYQVKPVEGCRVLIAAP